MGQVLTIIISYLQVRRMVTGSLGGMAKDSHLISDVVSLGLESRLGMNISPLHNSYSEKGLTFVLRAMPIFFKI